MDDVKQEKLSDALDTLVHFAVGRNEIKQLVDGLLEEDNVSPVTMEYELQILKIITIGWGLSYYLEKTPERQVIMEQFWNRINLLAKDISIALQPTLGEGFDYFAILKERLNQYVKTIDPRPDVTDPGITVGPLFAELCGDETHQYLTLAGKAIFHLSLGDVKKYLESIVICVNQADIAVSEKIDHEP